MVSRGTEPRSPDPPHLTLPQGSHQLANSPEVSVYGTNTVSSGLHHVSLQFVVMALECAPPAAADQVLLRKTNVYYVSTRGGRYTVRVQKGGVI